MQQETINSATNEIIDVSSNSFSSIWENILNMMSEYGLKLIGAILTLIIGMYVIRLLIRGLSRLLDNRNIDKTVQPYLITFISFMLKAMLFIAIASQIGIKSTSFIAILGAIGIAIGMAFQGTLGNLASGVLLLIFKPFKNGDLIEVQDELGFVNEISVFVTEIKTFQNKTVFIPNGPLLSGKIKNYSTIGNIRADIPFAIRYGSDIDKAKEIVQSIMDNSKYVLKKPHSSVYVSDLTSNNISLTALPFTTVENYWEVFWGLREEIVKKLSDAGFEAPYDHRINLTK